MVLYDFIAPFYDPCFRAVYRPFREKALGFLPPLKNATVLDLACGTGQNIPYLARRIGHDGRIIGVDRSGGMSRRARAVAKEEHLENVTLLQMDAHDLSPATLKAGTGLTSVDFVVCTYGYSAMKHDWQRVFHRSFSVLRPGGGYLIHDIHAQKRNLHVWAMEKFTRTNLSREAWSPLEHLGTDFHMEYFDRTTHLFGGQLYVAFATKP